MYLFCIMQNESIRLSYNNRIGEMNFLVILLSSYILDSLTKTVN